MSLCRRGLHQRWYSRCIETQDSLRELVAGEEPGGLDGYPSLGMVAAGFGFVGVVLGIDLDAEPGETIVPLAVQDLDVGVAVGIGLWKPDGGRSAGRGGEARLPAGAQVAAVADEFFDGREFVQDLDLDPTAAGGQLDAIPGAALVQNGQGWGLFLCDLVPDKLLAMAQGAGRGLGVWRLADLKWKSLQGQHEQAHDWLSGRRVRVRAAFAVLRKE